MEIEFANKARGGFPYSHVIKMRKGQFQEVSDPAVTDDLIRQRFALLGLPSQAGKSDDLEWKATYSRYEDVRNY